MESFQRSTGTQVVVCACLLLPQWASRKESDERAIMAGRETEDSVERSIERKVFHPRALDEVTFRHRLRQVQQFGTLHGPGSVEVRRISLAARVGTHIQGSRHDLKLSATDCRAAH